MQLNTMRYKAKIDDEMCKSSTMQEEHLTECHIKVSLLVQLSASYHLEPTAN